MRSLFLLIALLGFAPSAFAYRLCNNSLEDNVSVALRYTWWCGSSGAFNEPDYCTRTVGWFNVARNECRDIDFNFRPRMLGGGARVTTYAEGSNGSIWAGNSSSEPSNQGCVRDSAFHFTYGTRDNTPLSTRQECLQNNGRWVMFRDAHEEGSNFTGGVAPRVGFQVCNRSGKRAWTVVGRYNEFQREWTARGWWSVDDGECRVLVNDVKDRGVYFYARAETGGSTWIPQDSRRNFCISNQAFTDATANDCHANGAPYRWQELGWIPISATNGTYTWNLRP